MALPAGWRIVPGAKTLESGQSFVYQVRRHGEESIFALKKLKNTSRRERMERFAREVKAMIHLYGAGLAIPPIVEHQLEGKDPYFVMPWCQLGSLESRIESRFYANRPLDALDLLICIAQELHKLHNEGVAHRDLKPANVLLGDDGPLLTDFGLCLPIDDEAERLTATAEAIGSRFYIAPENESGINEEVDQRPADFYAFGKMTWVALANRPPFARELAGKPELRLRSVHNDQQFATLDYCLDELLNSDPRIRLSDWQVVIDELTAFQSVLRGEIPARTRTSLDDTLRVARRVRQAPALQAATQRRLEEHQVDEWMNEHLVASLTRIANGIRDDLLALTDASKETVEFRLNDQLNSTTVELYALTQVEPRFGFPGLVIGDVTIPSYPSVLLSIYPRSELGISGLHLGLYVVRTGRQFWLLQIPCLHWREAPPDSLLDRYLIKLGPLPIGRQASLSYAAELCHETMDMFRDMAHRYLSAVSEGKDPLDETVWPESPEETPASTDPNRPWVPR
jgi:serine/threonine protein kinase